LHSHIEYTKELDITAYTGYVSVILTDGIYDLEGTKENGSRRER